MGEKGTVHGVFRNGIPFASFGEGEGNLLLFFEGPGNEIPRGPVLNKLKRGLGLLTNYYRVYLMTRKSGLTEGYSTRDMSRDYAEMIEEHFSGRVDVVIGMSYGGLIAQHFAADHPDMFNHIVLAMTAHRLSAEGIEFDKKSAAAFGKVSWLFGRSVKRPQRESFASDLQIEVRAEMEHDSRESLSRIRVPVLIISGDRDYRFPLEYVRDMERLIRKSIVRIYPGRAHNVLEDRRFSVDVFDFTEGRLETWVSEGSSGTY